MHPSVHAASTPDKPAIIVAETGESISYAELDAASNRAAQLFARTDWGTRTSSPSCSTTRRIITG